ncbi:MAG: ABC transporter permease [Nitrospirae bacterium]|nr:ABC transporter permease [Nitrospirota bacterium]
MPNNPPSFLTRVFAIWHRHVRVYNKFLLSNGLPPFLEPLIFLAGIGLGLGRYIPSMGGVSYVRFLASGLIITAAMWTASFECTFGTFIRMEFGKVYDGMLAAPISVRDMLISEILWAGTKGLFFSSAVLFIMFVFRVLPVSITVLVPFVGFLTGMMFGAISLFVTSFVRNIQYFNFFFTGFLTPMFFFSGVLFPVENLPKAVRPIAEIVPLTHSVRLSRALCNGVFTPDLVIDLLYIVAATFVFGYFAIKRLRRRLID